VNVPNAACVWTKLTVAVLTAGLIEVMTGYGRKLEALLAFVEKATPTT
jgi:hypothetical protein